MPTPYLYKNRLQNFLHGLVMVLTMLALVLFIGGLLFGRLGMFLGLGLLLVSWLSSQAISVDLLMRRLRAQRLSLYEAPELFQLFEDLTRRAGLTDVVGLYYLPTATPNAFAAGTGSSSAVCVTDGLLRAMPERELAGVLAHELAHLRHHDTRLMGLASAMGRITAMFSRIGLLMLLFSIPAVSMGMGMGAFLLSGLILLAAPLVVLFLQLALMRSREFNADLNAARISGDPIGLALALQRLERMTPGGWWSRMIDPRQTVLEPTWLQSHPPTAERVTRLQDLAQSFEAPPAADDRFVPTRFHAPVATRRRYQPLFGKWQVVDRSSLR